MCRGKVLLRSRDTKISKEYTRHAEDKDLSYNGSPCVSHQATPEEIILYNIKVKIAA